METGSRLWMMNVEAGQASLIGLGLGRLSPIDLVCHRSIDHPCWLCSVSATSTMVTNYFSQPLVSIVSALWYKREATEQVRSVRFPRESSDVYSGTYLFLPPIPHFI